MAAQPVQQDWPAVQRAVENSPESGLESTFHRLVNEWHDETWFISSIKKRIAHPAHLKIIGLGLPAVPLIIKEMKRSADHWFWALEAITREDPAPGAEDMHELRDAWLAWAKSRGY